MSDMLLNLTLPQMILGWYLFMVPTATYQSITRRWSWRWQTVERAGRKEAVQYLGRTAERIDLSGVIFPTLNGGWTQIEAMKKQADRMEPLSLMTGFGDVLGDFVILDLEETGTRHLIGPWAGKQEYRMSLLEYTPDQPQPTGPGRSTVTPSSDAVDDGKTGSSAGKKSGAGWNDVVKGD